MPAVKGRQLKSPPGTMAVRTAQWRGQLILFRRPVDARCTIARSSITCAAPLAVRVLAMAMALRNPLAPRCPKRPNIVFIFSDDHAYQAISAYGDPRKLIETPNIDRLGQRGHAVRPLPGAQLDLRAQPGHGPDRQVLAPATASTTTPTAASTARRPRFPSCCRPPATRRPSSASGTWSATRPGFDYWHILPGQGVYYNPPMIDNGQRVQHDGLRHRHHHRPQPRLAQAARQVEAVPADVPAQGAAPRVGAGAAAPGPRPRPRIIPSRRRSSTTTPAAARPSTTRT